MSANCECGCGGGGCGCGCGCDDGGQNAVPLSTANRPGLPALAYRIGTHSAFFEAMIARLSSQDFPALARLTTRELADPSIALLDGWALVGDVLTFYQERIANEGYLRTATERRSILELARLIGYKLRPGVAASVYLAYTLDEDRTKNPPQPTRTTIPAGSRSQSVPAGPGQLPQAFETSLDLDARSAWNTLGLRLTQPQAFTAAMDAGTDITTRDTVYFNGTSTNLKPGDPLMFVLGTDDGQQTLRLVQSVETQTPQARTEIVLQSPPLAAATSGTSPLTFVTNAVSPYVADAARLFPDSTFAAKAAALLSNPPPASPPGLLENIQSSPQISGAATAALVQDCITSVTDLHETAVSRNFTRLEPWLADILTTLDSLVSQLQALGTKTSFDAPQTSAAVELKRSNLALGRLTSLLPSLALPPSLQPANSLQLARTVQGTFSPSSDMAPRLLSAFQPAAASMLYRAWTHYQNPVVAAPVVGAVRLKTGLFPGTYPGAPTVTAGANPTTSFDNPPAIYLDWAGLTTQDNLQNYQPLAVIALDGVYDKILAGSWVMIDRPKFTFDGPKSSQLVGRQQTFHKVTRVTSVAMTTNDSAFSAKSTQLTLDPPWLSDVLADSSHTAQDNQSLLNDLIESGAGLLPGTVVFAQTEMLDLAEEPLDVDIAGDTVELDEAYEGLESGRWVIVSGERTDIPNVTGVTGSELVMLLGVAQNTSVENVTRPGSVHTILTLANKLAYTYRRESVIVYGNVVRATHGQTYNEVLGNGDATQTFQQFLLKQKPLTFVAASNQEGTDSTLKVYVNNVEWHETGTLAGLTPTDRSFITLTTDDDTTGATFGNGRQGARLPTGSGNITAIYRSGIGQPGNVDAGQINLLQSRPLNVKAVINPLRASGGADRDSRDQARRNAPLAVMALDRLVSVQDYADFARTFAGIGKADASRLSDGRRELVYLTIAGAGDIPIDATSDLYKNLGLALHANGDPYQPVQIAVRQVRFLVISAHLRILPDYLWEPVAAAVRAALLDAFSFDKRNLGQPAFQSEAISVMQAVAGVAYVDLDKFDSVAESANADELAKLGTTLGLNPFVPAALARPNPQPVNPPDDAILPAELAYLSPALPDTLILNEVNS